MALSTRTSDRLIRAADRAARELRWVVRSCSKQEVRESYADVPRAVRNAERAIAAARRELARPAPAKPSKPRRAPVRPPSRPTYFVARVGHPGAYRYSLIGPDNRLMRSTYYESQADAVRAVEALGGFVGTHPHHGVIVVNMTSPPPDPATVDALRRFRAARSTPTARQEARP